MWLRSPSRCNVRKPGDITRLSALAGSFGCHLLGPRQLVVWSLTPRVPCSNCEKYVRHCGAMTVDTSGLLLVACYSGMFSHWLTPPRGAFVPPKGREIQQLYEWCYMLIFLHRACLLTLCVSFSFLIVTPSSYQRPQVREFWRTVCISLFGIEYYRLLERGRNAPPIELTRPLQCRIALSTFSLGRLVFWTRPTSQAALGH
ncbi:hypothetical protein BC832DRAFT_87691 [Gaertneriomyces semiglobifer]|nr:hypothetical protein BC832DRAFT_87691 [Gaertneriomyces semiglobifer]